MKISKPHDTGQYDTHMDKKINTKIVLLFKLKDKYVDWSTVQMKQGDDKTPVLV